MRVEISGCRARFRVREWGEVQGLGFRFQGVELDLGCRVGCRVQGVGLGP